MVFLVYNQQNLNKSIKFLRIFLLNRKINSTFALAISNWAMV